MARLRRTLPLLLVVLACPPAFVIDASATCPANQSFQSPPTSIGGFLNPRSIAVGDFNEDGIQDLVVTSPAVFSYGGTGNRLGVLLGNGIAGVGDGTFQPEVPYSAGNAPFTAAVGDYNEDGIADLAVTNWLGNDVSIMFGNGVAGVGNGTFGTPTNYPAGQRPWLIITGDYNEDGITDLAISNNGDYTVSVLLGQGSGGIGNGTFGPRSVYALNQLSTGLAFGDFNEDGITDLVATENYGGTIAVFFGLGSGGVGNGTFASAVHVPAGVEPFWIEPADFDQDGITDLAVANGSSDGVKLLKGNGALGVGDGTFAAPVTIAPGNDPGVTAGDWNLDGKLDLVVTTAKPGAGNGSLRVLIGNGNGTFVASPDTILLGHDPLVPIRGDFNEDGATDLVIPNYYDSHLSILYGGCYLVTAIEVSVAGARATPERVTVEWQLGDGAGAAVQIYRREGGGDWGARGSRFADGTGRVTHEDDDVAPGARYTYRIGRYTGASEEFGGEVEVTVPSLALALDGVHPNPTARGPLALRFSLASDAPAELRVMDAAGRQVAARSVGALGAGHHTITLFDDAPLRPGVYLIRLAQAGRAVTGKVTVLR